MNNQSLLHTFHWILGLIAAFVACVAVSCSNDSAIDGQIRAAESLMAQYPDSAMTVLQQVDFNAVSDRQKQRIGGLYAYGCVLHAIPLKLDSADIADGDDWFIGDYSVDEVRWLIVKSHDAKMHGNNIARLEYLKDAEFLAIRLECRFELAIIYQYLAKVYEEGFNGAVSKYYADKSMAILSELDCPKQLREARMMEVRALGAKRDYKGMLDSLLAMKDEVMANADEGYKVFFLDQTARAYVENGESDKAIKIWQSIYRNKEISPNTLAHMAWAYMHINRLDSAYVLIQQANSMPHNNSDEYLCRNVEYQLLEKMGRQSELAQIDSLRNAANEKIFEERKIEESSLAVNQKYDSTARLAWLDAADARARSRMLVYSIVVTVILAVGIIIYLRKRNRLLTLEHENDVLKIRGLQSNLYESSQRYEKTARRIDELFGSRFKLVNSLASSYFECRETAQEQKRIYSEVKTSLGDFSSDATTQELMHIVNGYKDGLMEHFKSDYPKLSAAQYRLALYLFCGFALPSISIFLGSDLRNIYVYKSRLKAIIAKGESPRKGEYLEYFA